MPGVKPTTVLYGRSLPPAFYRAMQKDRDLGSDLVITIGTSLEVGPANTVPEIGGVSSRRVFINVGEYSSAVTQGLGTFARGS